MASRAIAKINPGINFLQNAEFFTNDLMPGVQSGLGSYFRIILAVTLPVRIQITLDSGNTWDYLWSAVALNAGVEYSLDIPVRNGDLVNFRTPDVGGTNIDNCRVDEIIEDN